MAKKYEVKIRQGVLLNKTQRKVVERMSDADLAIIKHALLHGPHHTAETYKMSVRNVKAMLAGVGA